MGFIEKMELLINTFLFKLGELFWKVVPKPLKRSVYRIHIWKKHVFLWIQTVPSLIKNTIANIKTRISSLLIRIDIKALLISNYQAALEKYQANSSARLVKVKAIVLAPFLIIGEWLQGLSVGQTLLLITFTGGSILAAIGIGFSGHRLAKMSMGTERAPASAEEVVYERSEYYKKEKRHFELVSFRLPVYFADINEVKSVDIDFIATLSNRNSRKFLEKNEFQLRDHLILQVEPSVASFPLEDEGKEIIRKKIWSELNDFLKLYEIEGEVTELKLTYILAN